jgi:ATP-dependent DNA helicase RecG
MNIIHSSMEDNGSPPPVFETDENNAYFLCILPIHPLTESILGQEDDLRRDEGKTLIFKDLIDINPHLSLLVSEIRDQDKERIKERISEPIIEVLKYCQEPKSKDEIFGRIKLYKNTKNFNHHIKPLIEVGWLNLTLPNKPTSKNQQYYTTKFGEILLTVLSEECVSTFAIRTNPYTDPKLQMTFHGIEHPKTDYSNKTQNPKIFPDKMAMAL